jgi:hypothetical protein
MDSSWKLTSNSYVRWASPLANLWLFQPKTAADLEKTCFKKATCAMVISSGKPGPNDLKAVEAVAKLHRKMPVVLLDTAKLNLTGFSGPIPMMGETPKMSVFVKPAKDSGVTAAFKSYKRSMGNVKKMDDFVTGLMAASFEEAGLTELDAFPVIKMKSSGKRKRKGRRTPEEVQMLKDQMKAKKLAKEKKRRAEMDEEMGDLIQEDEGSDDELDATDEELDEYEAELEELEELEEGDAGDEEEAEEVEAEEVDEE